MSNYISIDKSIMRSLIHLVWGLFNLVVLTLISVGVIGTGWEIPWLLATLFYVSLYWILSSMLCDAILDLRGPKLKAGALD